MTTRQLDSETRSLIRAAISNAYYEARNHGRTMEAAADDAVEALIPIVASIDANAHGRGAIAVRDSFRREADASFDGVWREAVNLVDRLAAEVVPA